MVSATAAPFALYPLRVGLAIVFAYTGLEKLLDVEGQSAIVGLVGLPAPHGMTIAVGLLELVGAAAMLVGVWTRVAAVGLSLMMTMIIVVLKVPGPFWADGWGIDVAVLAALLTLALNGPGRPTWRSMLARSDAEAQGPRTSDPGPTDPVAAAQERRDGSI